MKSKNNAQRGLDRGPRQRVVPAGIAAYRTGQVLGPGGQRVKTEQRSAPGPALVPRKRHHAQEARIDGSNSTGLSGPPRRPRESATVDEDGNQVPLVARPSGRTI